MCLHTSVRDLATHYYPLHSLVLTCRLSLAEGLTLVRCSSWRLKEASCPITGDDLGRPPETQRRLTERRADGTKPSAMERSGDLVVPMHNDSFASENLV